MQDARKTDTRCEMRDARLSTDFLVSRISPLASIYFLLFPFSILKAQDAQFTQFYASPLVQNPAFAGSALAPRLFAHYRTQWPGTGAPFKTYTFSGDHHVRAYNFGLGFVFQAERNPANTFNSTGIHAQYAYHAKLTQRWSMNFGGQIGYVERNLGYSGLVFPNQIDDFGRLVSQGSDPLLESAPQSRFVDLSLGSLIYNPTNWVGATLHHANNPSQENQGLLERLPRRLTVTAGHVFYLNGDEPDGLLKTDLPPSITVAMLYRRQLKFQQVDVGAYYHLAPFVAGIWYRGLPVLGGAEGVFNQDAVSALVGLRQDNLSIGYSYDYNLSGIVGTFGGSHEISLSYTFDRPGPKKKKQRALPCPSF